MNKSDKKQYKFGIIGLGAIAETHATAISKIDSAILTAVFDTDEEKAKNFAAKFKVKAYSNLNSFLADTDIDIVSITTPSGLHQDAAVCAANAGKNIIVEKPLEITVERCNKIIEAAKNKGVLLAGIFQSRFYDASVLTKKALESGRFGKLILVSAYVKWFRSQEYYDSGAWRGSKEIDGGGALMNQSIHAVDLLQWFGGTVLSVSAFADTLSHQRITVEDTLVSTLKFKNGALGVIEATTSAWPGFPKRIEILGTKGSVVFEEENIVRWNFDKETQEDERIRKDFANTSSASGATDPRAISYEGHIRQIRDFVSALENKSEPSINGIEAKKSVELIEAIYKSVETGKTIDL